MCRGTVFGEGVQLPLDSVHPDIRHHYKRDYGFINVDQCISSEVHELLKNGVATVGGSCCGHGKLQAHAYIFPEYKKRAKQLGYTVTQFKAMDGTPIDGVLLKTGTQNGVLKLPDGVRLHD